MVSSRQETPNRQASWTSRILLVVAAVMWSTAGLFAKAPIFDDWPVESRGVLLAFWRAAFAAGFLACFVRNVRWSWRLLPMAISFAAMNWVYLGAMVRVEASIAIWLQYTAPAWVLLGSLFVLREKVLLRDWIMLICATVGVTVIVAFQVSEVSLTGLLFGLLSGFFFAGVIVSLRSLREFDPVWLIFVNHAVTAICFLPFFVTWQIYPSAGQWPYLAAFGILQMGIPYVLFANAVRHVSGHEAAAISLLEPILVPVWVYLVWRNSAGYEFPSVPTLLGATLILAGLLIRYGRLRPARK